MTMTMTADKNEKTIADLETALANRPVTVRYYARDRINPTTHAIGEVTVITRRGATEYWPVFEGGVITATAYKTLTSPMWFD